MNGTNLWIITLPLFIMPAACGTGAEEDPYADCPGVYGYNITEYDFGEPVMTPGGVAVDTGGQEVDLDAVDCIVDAVEACYAGKAKDSPAYLAGIDRGCLRIEVAHDWYWNECVENHQLFPCDLSYYETCRDRVPDPENGVCACACAGVIQDSNLMIVTPNLAALSHELTHVIHEVRDPVPEDFKPCVDGIRANNCASYLVTDGALTATSALTAYSAPPEPVGCTTTFPQQ